VDALIAPPPAVVRACASAEYVLLNEDQILVRHLHSTGLILVDIVSWSAACLWRLSASGSLCPLWWQVDDDLLCDDTR
jgi:hypothetical protein